MEILLGLFGIAVVVAPFIMGIVNINRINSLMRRIEQLEFSLIRHNNEIEQLQSVKANAADTHQVQMSPREEIHLATEEQPAAEVRSPAVSAPRTTPEVLKPVEEPLAQAKEPIVEEHPVEVAPGILASPDLTSAKRSRTRSEWEALIGGKVLNRIGALALIMGMGFFLKYAFDNNWINETMRVALGAISGAALQVLAARTQKKGYDIFSQGLVGAGISILYLSVYAAFNFYHIVPQLIAFFLMSGVTMLALWQATKYDSLAIALLGWAGGFLTPFMLSTGEANAVGLFTYVALLIAGLLTMLLAKEKWIVLEPLTLAATYFIYFLWFEGVYKPESRIVAIFFLTLFWALFFGFEAFRNIRRMESGFVLRQMLSAVNGLVYYIGLYQLLEPDLHALAGLVTLFIAIPYYMMFELLRKKSDVSSALLSRYVLGAIVFLFTATAVQFVGFMTVTLWSFEAFLVAYLGSLRRLKPLWVGSVMMFGIALFKLVLSDGSLSFLPLEEFRLLFNMRALAYLTLAATMLLTAEIFTRSDDRLASGFSLTLGYAWCLTIFIAVTVETVDFFGRSMLYASRPPLDYLQFKRDLTVGMVWMACSVGVVWFGFWRDRKPAVHASVAILGLSVVFAGLRSVSFDPMESYSLIFNYRVLAMGVLIAGTVGHILLRKRFASEVKPSSAMQTMLYLGVVGLVFVLLTAETYDGFESRLLGATGNMFELLSFKRILTLAVVWTAYSIGLTWFGLTKRDRLVAYLGIGVMGLGFFTGLIRSTWYSPLEFFTLILNFRFLFVCLLVLGAIVQLAMWRSMGQRLTYAIDPTSILGLVIVSFIFVLLTSETIDYYEHSIAPIQSILLNGWNAYLDEQVNSLRNKQQLTLSSVWLVYSIILMVAGIWRRRRNIRLVAIGLFGLTILKIFIYDLSFLETLYRIFSFMGLGVILLGVSYLYQKYKAIILEDKVKNEPVRLPNERAF